MPNLAAALLLFGALGKTEAADYSHTPCRHDASKRHSISTAWSEGEMLAQLGPADRTRTEVGPHGVVTQHIYHPCAQDSAATTIVMTHAGKVVESHRDMTP